MTEDLKKAEEQTDMHAFRHNPCRCSDCENARYLKEKKANEEAYVNPLKGGKGVSSLSVSSSYGGGESITKLEMLG